MKRNILIDLLIWLSLVSCSPEIEFLIEAESMMEHGGWVIDQQSMMQMGSPYIMAHGLGVPVKDASTVINVSEAGCYRLWVRTRDWTRSWSSHSAGKFQVLVNGKALDVTFGTESADWSWQDGGTVSLEKGENTIALHDLTGFNARCDALFLTSDIDMVPPSGSVELADFRRGINSISLQDKGEYDLVVVGGGIAGCCAAVSAARSGCKVALVHNRYVLGGNNSSEVRVGLSGLIMQQPYPALGNLMDELGGVGHWTHYEAVQNPDSERSRQIMEVLAEHPEKMHHNAGVASNYEDDKKLALILSEPGITYFPGVHVKEVRKEGDRITAVVGQEISTGEEYLFRGKLFADCTGDGDVGYLAGADYRMGREGKSQTGEEHAPEAADSLVMGTSVQWYAETRDEVSTFPECPWAVQFTERTCCPMTRGDWDWETGMNHDQITDIEYIRDYALRTVFGNWDYLKNRSSMKAEFARQSLEWVAYIGGKRESRRLLGDVILCEQDLMEGRVYDDASFTTTWEIDLHYPQQMKEFAEEPFLSYCEKYEIEPYPVPYRCLYSRNVDNLFMAGRNISVTHVALGTVRVMRTGGMMGEVVGMAASVCSENDVLPRDVYHSHLPHLKRLMSEGVGKLGF